MKLFALVPMRHHSQRVPGKNYRDLAGKPLYQHIIETLLGLEIQDETDTHKDMQQLARERWKARSGRLGEKGDG